MSDVEVKQEASIPVQSRVDIRTLANLSINWEESGVEIGSMSQLISWSMELLLDTMKKSGVLKVVVGSVSEANQYLNEKGLYQKGLYERGRKKISTALEFENMRFEGIDPKTYVSRHYHMVHNKRSVDAPGTGKPFVGVPGFDMEKALEIAKEFDDKHQEETRVESKNRMRELIDSGQVKGLVTEKELSDERKLAKMKKEDEEYIEELKKAGPREDAIVRD